MVGVPALIRRLGAAALTAGALLLGTAAPAQAHAGVVLTVQNDGRGAVSVDIAWADGHPVTAADPIAGTMMAISSAGAQVGPAPLSRLPGTSTVVYSGALKPGRWQVTVDLAVPGVGHCAADVVVAAGSKPASPSSQRCGDPVPPAAAAPTPASASSSEGSPLWLLFGAAGVIALGTVVAVLLSRRRPSR